MRIKSFPPKYLEFVYGANPYDNCFFDDSVKIGKGTKIWPGVTVAEGAEIGENCEIGKGVSLVGNVKIGNNCVIGGAGLPVIERSVIGDNVKMKHTCGIRDCEIGRDSNISEFVSVANLAGGVKSKTKIGEKCMIGIHTSIMGGAVIGDECYIADNARISGTLILSPRTYFNPARAIKDKRYPSYQNDCSWYLFGNYLALINPVGPDERKAFTDEILKQMNGDVLAARIRLKMTRQHLSQRTSIQAIQKEGKKAFPCILGECDCIKSQFKEEKNPA